MMCRDGPDCAPTAGRAPPKGEGRTGRTEGKDKNDNDERTSDDVAACFL